MIRVSHVLFLAETPGRFTFAGAESHLMVLLPALRREGVDAELIAMIGSPGPTIDRRLADLEQQGITVTRVVMDRRRHWHWLFLRRPPWLKRLRLVLTSRQDRVIHVHMSFVGVVVTAWLARCPFIVPGIHSDAPSYRKLHWRLWLRFIDRIVRHYIAVSNRVRDYYMAVSGINPNKISTVYHGLEPLETSVSGAKLREVHHIPMDAFVVGFVGRLTEAKNLPVLVKALERLPDVYGVIVGDGEMAETLRSMVDDMGISNVRFLGAQANGAGFMPMFDVLCLPSRWEGLGLVLIEAMLQRTPVIGSRAGAIPEILGGGDYGVLFNSGDVPGLVNAITQLRNDAEARLKLAEHAFEYALRTFSVHNMAQQTLQVYEKVRCLDR